MEQNLTQIKVFITQSNPAPLNPPPVFDQGILRDMHEWLSHLRQLREITTTC